VPRVFPGSEITQLVITQVYQPAEGTRSVLFSSLPASKHGLAQQQAQADSKPHTRRNELEDISHVERLNAGIADGIQERKSPEHQHKQSDDNPSAPLMLLTFGVVCTLRLA
jgi:hypothetical protein